VESGTRKDVALIIPNKKFLDMKGKPDLDDEDNMMDQKLTVKCFFSCPRNVSYPHFTISMVQKTKWKYITWGRKL